MSDEDLIVGFGNILAELKLHRTKKNRLLLQSLACPMREVPEFRPGSLWKGNVWVCGRRDLDAWLSGILGRCEIPKTYQSVKDDIVVGKSAIMTLLHVPHSYDSQNDKWPCVQALIEKHQAPIRKLGGRWITRVSLVHEWLTQELRGAM